VLLAGLGAAATITWAPVVAHPSFDRSKPALILDFLGGGWSDADDGFDYAIDAHARTVIALLDSMATEPVELVGHSLGGSVAISLAAQRPDLVDRLVVIEPNLDPGVGSTSVEIATFSEDEFVRSGHDDMVERELRRGATGDAISAEYARTLRRWSSRGLHRTAVSLLAERPATFREQLAAFPGERVYVSGELSREDLGPIRAIGCEVRVVPNAGHVVMVDNLDAFVAAIG
jgi:pimeloyl-ACP methyl ester carboxylesterase